MARAPRPRWIGKSKSDVAVTVRGSLLDRGAGGLEPGQILAPQLRANLRQHMGVVAVEPDQLFGLEHLDVDQSAVDRREGQSLETEHFLLRAVDLARDDQHQVLDADAVFA